MVYFATRGLQGRTHAVNCTVCLLDRANATVLIGSDDSRSERNTDYSIHDMKARSAQMVMVEIPMVMSNSNSNGNR
jgi:hypothetical protein